MDDSRFHSSYIPVLKYLRPQLFIIIKNFLKNFEDDVVKYLKNSDVFVVDAEGAMTAERCEFHFKHFGLDVTKTVGVVKKAFLWNEEFAKFLIDFYGADKEKLVVSGSPKFSLSRYIQDIQLDKKINSKKKIGFVGRFSVSNDYMRRTVLKTIIERDSQKDIYSHGVYGEINVLTVYLNVIKRIIKETDYIISIRPHPNEFVESWFTLREIYGDRIIISEDEDYLEWMIDLDTIVTCPSTSMLESIMHNKKVICIDKITNAHTMHAYFEDMLDQLVIATIRPDNEEELFEIIKSSKLVMPERSNNFKNTIKRYYDLSENSGNQAIEKILKFILNNYRSSIMNLIKGYIYFPIFYLINLYTWLKTYIRRKSEFNYHYNLINTRPPKILNTLSKKIIDSIHND